MAQERAPLPYIKPQSLGLQGKQAHRHMLLSAPSGFGKTALARHLSESRCGETFWCQLLGRNEGMWLLHRIIRCFSLEGIRVTNKAFDQALLECIEAIEARLNDCSRPLVVFDGLDELTQEQQINLLHLLDAIAPLCQLILTMRTDQALLRDWFVAHQGQLISEQELMFSPQECAAQGVIDKSLSEDEAAIYCWPLAHVIALQNNDPECHQAALNAFSLKLLSPLDDDARLVLYSAAFAPAFDVEYLVKVTANSEAPEILKSLLGLGFFQEVSPKQFLLKAIYRAGVRHEFQYLAWNTRKAMKKRAAVYWARTGQHEQALGFCVQFQLWEACVEVLHLVAEQFIYSGRFEDMHKWFEALPPEYIDSDPLLMVYRVWCFPEYQKINGSDVYLQQVEQMLAPDMHTRKHRHWLKANVHLSALRAYICRISGDYQGAVENAQSAVSYASEGAPAMLSRLYTTIGQDLYLKGEVVAATASLSQAMALGKQYKKHHDVVIAVGYTVAALELSGRFSQAIALFNETMNWFAESGFMKTDGARILNDPLTDAYRETFQFAEALERSDNMVRFCEETTPALHHLTTYMRRYRLAVSRDDAREACHAIAQAEAFRDILGVSWAFGWAPVSAMRAEYEIRFGDLRRADAYFKERESLLLDNQSFSTECERLIYALWLEKKGKYKEARKQLLIIRDAAAGDQRFYQVIKAEVQLALLVYERDPASALLHMRDAIRSVPEGEQLIGVFLWHGKSVLPLLEQVGTQLYQDLDGLRLVKEIRQHARQRWPEGRSGSVLDVLSERQITILKLLVNGDQDKVIARKLDISPGTVKTHLRAIYRKLDCNNRSQAVSIAMEEGLLLLDHQAAH